MQVATITDCCFRDEALRLQPRSKLQGVTRRTGAIEKAYEMLQESVGTPLSDEDEPIMRRAERACVIEVFPEVANGLPAIVVRPAYGEAPLHLAAKLPGPYTGGVASNEKVVSVLAEALCLEVNLDHWTVDQDWWNAPHEHLCEPVSPNMLLKECSCSACGGRTGDSVVGQYDAPAEPRKMLTTNFRIFAVSRVEPISISRRNRW